MKLKELNIDKFDEFVRNNKYKSHFYNQQLGESYQRRKKEPYTILFRIS